MSNADVVYKKLLKEIIDNGISSEGQIVRPKWSDGVPAHTISKFGAVNRYDLNVEFPIQTIRPTPFSNCVDEILWIWQKKSNNVNDLNSKIWDSWANEDGSIGKAYGYQLRQQHQYKEGLFDQVDRVLFDLKNNPASRRIMTGLYNFQDLHEMNLAPCVYECLFNVLDGRLYMHVNQRSADLVVAGGWNMTQYAILQHMFAQVSGLGVGEMFYTITNAHIYDRHIDMAKELIVREEFPAPKLKIDPDIKNFYDFKVDSFELSNYKTGKQIKNIPVAV